MCRKLIFLVSVVLVLSMAGKASAVPIAFTWTNTTGNGDWDDAANWTPGGGPPGDNDPCDTVTIPGTIDRGPIIGPGSDVTVASISGPDPGAINHVVVDINTGGSLFIHDTWTYSGGSGSGKVTINIHGNLTIDPDESADGDQVFRAPDEGTAYVNIFPGANIWVSGAFRGADEEDSWYFVTMTGGDVNCGWFKLGDNGSGDFIMTGGKFVTRRNVVVEGFNLNESFTIRGRNEGTFFEVLVGGEGSPAELIIGGSLRTPQEDIASAWINLDNGYIECKEWACAGDNWVLDINEGLLRIKNPVETTEEEVQGWIDAVPPLITGWNDTVTPIVTTDGADLVVTVSFLHTRAYNPEPGNQATNVCPNDLELTWTPGIYAQDSNGSEVYFGTDFQSVRDANTDEPCGVHIGPTSANSWTPPGPIEIGTTYYWRVDTVNDVCDPCLWKGGVWQFTTDDGRAYDPYPTNDIRGIGYGEVSPLSWTASCVADKHKVYWGVPSSIVLFEDDFEDGFDPGWSSTTGWSIFDGNSDPNTYAPHNNNLAKATAGTLTSGNIDASDANSINVSFVIRLADQAGAGAVTLNYYNGATYVPVADWNSLDPCDTWLSYSDTTTDSQYTDISNFRIQLVSTLTGPNSVYINNVSVTNNWPVAAEYYAGETSDSNWPVTVEAWKNYSWRIDTITTGGQKVKGDHWTFTTGLGGLLMYYKFDGGTPGNPLPTPTITDSTGNFTFNTFTAGGGTALYGESNPVVLSSTASADFEPNAGLYRWDPCEPNEIDPLRLSGYQYTIELWMRPETLNDDHGDITLIGKSGGPWRLQINDPGSDNELRQTHNGNDEGVEDIVVAEEWQHVAAVYDQLDPDEDQMRLYYNGVLINTNDEGPNPSDNNEPVGIGMEIQADGTTGGFFDGMIDEVRIFDIALPICELLVEPGPEYPICPDPPDGELDVDPCGVVLSWTPGSEATSHKVYFSTDYVDVDTFLPSTKIYEGPNTSVPLDDLDVGTTYYWRVVESGSGPWNGRIWRFTTTYVITDPTLRVWYEFSETSGDRAYDHSGHGFHADGADDQWDTTSGMCLPGCLVFDDDIALQPSNRIFDTLTNEITVAVWLKLKIGYSTSKDLAVFDTGGSGAEYKLQAVVPDEDGSVVWRAGNDSNDLLIWNEASPGGWQGDWHHLAFVKDETAETMTIYLDGLPVASKSGVISSLTNNIRRSTPFKIGAYGWHSSTYEGSMDDFMVYDRVLNDSEIAELARCGDVDTAWGPSPYDGQLDALHDVNVTWKPGDSVKQHKVFFGTSKSQVQNMTDPCAVQDACEYEPGPLLLDTYYYWRIDEVNDGPPVNPNSPWPGPVWRFKVADYIILDNFESYNETDNKVASTWYENSDNGTGSWLSLAQELYGKPVHTGEQAMRYEYYTDAPPAWWWITKDYAEAWLEYDPSMDWVTPGVRMVALFFYGQSGNDYTDAEQMYVGVEDSDGLYAEMRYGDNEGEDMNDINEPEWHRWDIPFAYFSDGDFTESPNDVNFRSIFRFSIGFGDRDVPVPAGEGAVYFDDIRLNLPICIPEEGPEQDLSGNCIVDLADVGIMAEDWLASDVNLADIVGPIEEPCDANLVGHWALDGDACDSSGNNYHGTLEGSYQWVTGHNDVDVGDFALQFTGSGGRLLVEDEGNTPELRPLYEVTVSAWVYFTQDQDSARVVVKGRNDHEAYEIEIDDDDHFVFNVRDANGDRWAVESESGNIESGEWLHLAGTVGEDGNSVKSYVNGQLDDSRNDANLAEQGRTLARDVNDGFAIGSKAEELGNGYIGTADEVRVYNYALSAAEIAHLATDGTGIISLTSPANLFLDDPDMEVIDFKDFAELLLHWGDKAYWPPELE